MGVFFVPCILRKRYEIKKITECVLSENSVLKLWHWIYAKMLYGRNDALKVSIIFELVL